MKKLFLPLVIIVATCNVACHESAASPGRGKKVPAAKTAPAASTSATNAGFATDAAIILARKEVPVLCYHQIRDWTSGDSKSARDIVVPVNLFKAHLKMLADSGYHTILPDQLYDYLTTGA